MTDYNKFIGTGRLTRDLELKYTNSNKAVTKGSIACNRKYGDTEKVLFLDFVAWEKTAELLSEYTKKGSRVLLEGRLEQESWENKDGVKQNKIVLVVENMQFLEKKDV